MKKFLLRTILRITGWKDEGLPPEVPRCVMISFPHTSNWDLALLMTFAHLYDVPLKFMIKDTLMKGLPGKILRALGGVPVDRSKSNNLVDQMARVIGETPRIALSVPPEGTRKKVEYWKSGFYHIALKAGVPILLSYIDGPRRAFGTGPLIYPTGDIEKDMEKIREFYEPIKGFYPQLTSPIRLKPQVAVPSSASGTPPESPVLGE